MKNIKGRSFSSVKTLPGVRRTKGDLVRSEEEEEEEDSEDADGDLRRETPEVREARLDPETDEMGGERARVLPFP